MATRVQYIVNLYRRTGNEKYLENARKYGALLRIDERRSPSLFGRSRGYILNN